MWPLINYSGDAMLADASGDFIVAEEAGEEMGGEAGGEEEGEEEGTRGEEEENDDLDPPFFVFVSSLVSFCICSPRSLVVTPYDFLISSKASFWSLTASAIFSFTLRLVKYTASNANKKPNANVQMAAIPTQYAV